MTIKCDNCDEFGHLGRDWPRQDFDVTARDRNIVQIDENSLEENLNHSIELEKFTFLDIKSLIECKFNENIENCKVCLILKINKLPFQTVRARAQAPLQIIHSDVMGKIRSSTYPRGYKYISLVIDDYSRLAMAYAMKLKDETEKLNEIKQKLIKGFEMTDLEETQVDSDGLHPKGTPMITNQTANRKQKNRKENEKVEEFIVILEIFHNVKAIRTLLYLANTSRPDICCTINVLSKHQNNPTENEWRIKQVFFYWKGTRMLGLNYLGKSYDLRAYSDASFADCKESRTTSGFVIKLFGDSITWRTKIRLTNSIMNVEKTNE
ncbi:uncharacterized protein LOC107981766 [Nasonia vitripennis]|uniref:Uncharacterized protein n=1 Tax=Nasonia vitripennis TaxID=7425 RepID=A0A7M7IT12_NASVI|nr:uncharacterized protein LOC107981766 [Nasonia vitripennis]